MGRPPGSVGRTQLKPEELFRVQILSRDAKMGPTEIQRITGYSIYQIKYAIKKKTPTIGKRTGRPPKGSSGSAYKDAGQDEAGQDQAEEMETEANEEEQVEQQVRQLLTEQAEQPPADQGSPSALSPSPVA